MLSFLHILHDYPLIPVFLLANLVIGLWARRKSKVNSFEDYALASRSLPTGVLVMTLLGTLLAKGDLSLPDFIYHYGVLGILLLGSIVVTFLFMGTFVAPYLVYFDEEMTFGDLMRRFYGPVAQVVTGVIGILISLLMISSQVRALGTLGVELLGVDPLIAILCFGGMVILYSLLGGMRAVSYTDILQTIAALLVFSWIAQALLQDIGGWGALVEKLPKHHAEKLRCVDHPSFWSLFRENAFWHMIPVFTLTPPVVQRMLIAQDKRQVRRMWYASGFLVFLLGCIIVLIGLSAVVGGERLGIEASKGGVLPHLIHKLFWDNKWVMQVMFVGVLGLLLSTIDSHLHSIGITFVKDLVEPLRGGVALSARKRTLYAKVGMSVVGLVVLIISLIHGKVALAMNSLRYYEYAVAIAAMLVVPLIIGIIGFKTHYSGFIAFCAVYLPFLLGIWKWKGSLHIAYLIAIPMATVAYFVSHIVYNRGILTLKRSELTIAERLWLPSWQGTERVLKSWLKAPLHLPTLADRKVISTPIHTLGLSILIFALYTFSSLVIGSGGVGTAHFMAAVHVVGITLCCGLMLEGVWPDRLKPYFALYWYITLFYCLSLGATLTFLRTHEGVMSAALWAGSIMLLAFVVDSRSFFVLSSLGIGLAVAGWRIAIGYLPNGLGSSTNIAFGICVGLVAIGVFLFNRKKEVYAEERLYWNRIATSSLGHDLRGTVQMLSGAGSVLEGSFKLGEATKNSKGEEGYWIPKEQSQFLENFSERMIERSQETKQEIANFISFIEKQVMGTFEQEEVSMRKMVEEGMHKIEDRLVGRVKLTLTCTKDFSAKVLAGIFPNVITNLIANAASHGEASEVKIEIDGERRRVTVWDNGKGIPSDVLPHIFDLNYSTRQSNCNSGVGLSFVKMVMRASSGKVSCRSRHGDKDSFAEFMMELP